ncbi:hypothetical protein MSG28_015492 [Choristoneura fumiferana]|uniref:Uncharacterized protein n=1 Tax=Choristoneura fumiferana TaxID=7141 RepID=A0ACC0KB21_CHOFU|nr:hypothetical protein MSG28_015492 [Choristoneura fumiferana]
MSEKNHTSRLSAYKNAGVGVGELRRKRAEQSVALRKQARDEQLLKRRALSPEAKDEELPVEKLPTPAEIVKGLKSSDVAVMTSSARAARRVLSREQNPPITIMVTAGVIAPLVAALERDDCHDLQFEAAWALTNIASGTHDHTMAVIEGGAIPKLVGLLARGGSVGEQSAWALGNIAGDGPGPRDAVLAAGALPALLPSMAPSAPAAQLRTAVWTYSNFCRNKNPLVNFELVAPALPFVSELLELNDTDVLADACWAISYLTDGPNDRIEEVQLTPHLLQRVVKLLDHKSPGVKTPALRAAGNMLTGSDEQTDRCLDAGCISYLLNLLSCGKSSLVKEAAWAASNILAGTQAAEKYGQVEPLCIRLEEIGALDKIEGLQTHENEQGQTSRRIA